MIIKSISTIMCMVRHVDKYKITFKLLLYLLLYLYRARIGIGIDN